MNNLMYPQPYNYNQLLLEELMKINDTLKRIEKKLDSQKPTKNENDYLKKDDNYYMI